MVAEAILAYGFRNRGLGEGARGGGGGNYLRVNEVSSGTTNIGGSPGIVMPERAHRNIKDRGVHDCV